jgi:arylsulfatase A-like enzyme
MIDRIRRMILGFSETVACALSLRFERYYANSVCSPSRVSLITGRNSARHRTTQWINPYARNGDRYDPTGWPNKTQSYCNVCFAK